MQVQQHHSYTMSTVIPKEHLNTLYVCCFKFLKDSAVISAITCHLPVLIMDQDRLWKLHFLYSWSRHLEWLATDLLSTDMSLTTFVS